MFCLDLNKATLKNMFDHWTKKIQSIRTTTTTNPERNNVYFCSLSVRNSTTASVFHLSMLSVSITSLLSSNSFMIGSAPAAYLISRPGKPFGRSLFTNACTWGYLPNFHPHTMSWAKGYICLAAMSSVSGWQHCWQGSIRESKWNCGNSLHELHWRLDENPRDKHTSAPNSWHQLTTA